MAEFNWDRLLRRIDDGAVVLFPFDAGSPPPARSAATMISDPARGRVLLFGGEGADGLLGDTWELGPI